MWKGMRIQHWLCQPWRVRVDSMLKIKHSLSLEERSIFVISLQLNWSLLALWSSIDRWTETIPGITSERMNTTWWSTCRRQRAHCDQWYSDGSFFKQSRRRYHVGNTTVTSTSRRWDVNQPGKWIEATCLAVAGHDKIKAPWKECAEYYDTYKPTLAEINPKEDYIKFDQYTKAFSHIGPVPDLQGRLMVIVTQVRVFEQNFIRVMEGLSRACEFYAKLMLSGIYDFLENCEHWKQ